MSRDRDRERENDKKKKSQTKRVGDLNHDIHRPLLSPPVRYYDTCTVDTRVALMLGPVFCFLFFVLVVVCFYSVF